MLACCRHAVSPPEGSPGSLPAIGNEKGPPHRGLFCGLWPRTSWRAPAWRSPSCTAPGQKTARPDGKPEKVQKPLRAPHGIDLSLQSLTASASRSARQTVQCPPATRHRHDTTMPPDTPCVPPGGICCPAVPTRPPSGTAPKNKYAQPCRSMQPCYLQLPGSFPAIADEVPHPHRQMPEVSGTNVSAPEGLPSCSPRPFGRAHDHAPS